MSIHEMKRTSRMGFGICNEFLGDGPNKLFNIKFALESVQMNLGPGMTFRGESVYFEGFQSQVLLYSRIQFLIGVHYFNSGTRSCISS